jgi:hypothetical protein
MTISADRFVEAACEVRSPEAIEKVDIIRNGSVIQTFMNPSMTNDTFVAQARIPVNGTCWIAARCFEKRGDTVRFAHTAPIWIVTDGKPFAPKRYAAEYFLKKTREIIATVREEAYSDEDAWAAALETYRTAEEMYERLAKGGK